MNAQLNLNRPEVWKRADEVIYAVEFDKVLEHFGVVEILQVCPIDGINSIVLAHREKATWESLPFVTWNFNHNGTGFYEGHYDMDYPTAVKDFAKRVERGY